ncbi:MAG: hypothetical protein V8R43_06875 [Dorea sp.]
MKFLKQTLFFIIAGITISITFCSTAYAATAYSKFSLSPSQSSEDNLADSSDRSLHTTKYVVTSAQATLHTDQEITILLPAPSKKETLS